MSTIKDINHKQGFVPTEYFIINGLDGNPVDLITNTWTAEIRVRKGFKSTASLVETFTTANGKLELDTGTLGRINFNFDGTEFQDINIKGMEKSFYYDFQVTDGVSGTSYDIYTGDWTVTSNF